MLQPIISQDGKINLFLTNMSKNSTFFILSYLCLALIGIFGLGTVEAVTSYLGLEDNQLVRWSQKLAYISFAVLSVANFRALTAKPAMAGVYTSATALKKEIILTIDPYISFSPNGIVVYGFLGIWIALVSLFSFKKDQFRACNIIGLILGIVYIVVSIPYLPLPIVAVCNIAKGVLAFLWFGLLGLYMLKKINRISI
ncbi:hypothetical protein STRMA_0772 [Streptococcus macacae NCTC 11558]|uniref:DUF4386 domain-containing protein n=2 Tax=Streptococcus macacae TaxID=1339 RepID=G5JUE9_9STRE|nr:hypothetical protein STRMA_0772 [Streptococcus macacae NCTC 11558]